MDEFIQNNKDSRGEIKTGSQAEEISEVDSKELPLFKALFSAHSDALTELNGKQLNGNGALNGKSSLNGNGKSNGNSVLNNHIGLSGNGTSDGTHMNGNFKQNGNGTMNGKNTNTINGNDKKDLNGNASELINDEQPEVFKGVKFFNTQDQSFSFTIDNPTHVLLLVTNRMTMPEVTIINDVLMPGDYLVMLDKSKVCPGFHYYKLYFEVNGEACDSYRFNDIMPDKRFCLQAMKEVAVIL